MIRAMTTMILLAATIGMANAASLGGDEKAGEFRSPGKPSHPLQVEIRTAGTLEVGKEMPVEVQVHSGFPLSDLRMQATTSNGLLLSSQREHYLQKAGPADDAAVFELMVTPSADGQHELRLTISARIGDSTWSREIVHRLKVGDAAAVQREIEPAETVKGHDGREERRVRGSQAVTRN